ncbi:glycoside hydrolase 5 family protein [Klebsiella sp. R390]|uniref:glycoside hydrolase 5 family protein n=1 Tax=Klebsiella sp. R390 TaxID=2755400 RepID=UPI003DA84D08
MRLKKYQTWLSLPCLALSLLFPLRVCSQNLPISEFVEQHGGQFTLGGKPFRFMGTNNYYLHYKSDQAIDDVLDSAVAMDLKVIRIWGFMDGVDRSAGTPYTLQPTLGVYAPPAGVNSALERLDYTLSQAKKKGIRIVLVLTNNWPDFGGIPQYTAWIGSTEHDDFYRDPRLITAYKQYVKFLLTHVNRYTGIPYQQEPTIMTFQLANEPRAASDPSGDLLVNWAREMSDYVRQLAPRHLISLGSEGFFNRPDSTDWTYNGKEGVDWQRIVQLPNINYEPIHLYTDQWGKTNAEQWGTQWILDHISAAKKANKPMVLEEYGISATSPYNRTLIYERWNRIALTHGMAGTMFWILSGKDPQSPGGVYPDYDGYRIRNDHSATVQMLQTYAKAFAGEHPVFHDKVYFAYPLAGRAVTTRELAVSVYPMLYGTQPQKVVLTVDGKPFALRETQHEGYFTVTLNTAQLGYGEKTFHVEVLKNDGQTIAETLEVTLLPPGQSARQ